MVFFFLLVWAHPISSALTSLNDTTLIHYLHLLDDIQRHPTAVKKLPPTIPVKNESSEIRVEMTFIPLEVVEVDHSREVLTITCMISVVWTDGNLAWNPADYGDIEAVELEPGSLWTPRVIVQNAVMDHVVDVGQMGNVVLHHRGIMYASGARSMQTTCSLDFANYPFDFQRCQVIFTPQSLHGISLRRGISLTATSLDVQEFEGQSPTGGEWEFTSVSCAERFQTLRNLTFLEFTLHLKRKTQFYTFGFIIPLLLFTFTNCMVFLIPPESGEKISFLVSLFLSNAIFSSYVNDVMPHGLVVVPHIVIHIAAMWVTSLATILATVFVLRRFHAELAGPDRHVPQGDTSSTDHSINRMTNVSDAFR